MASGGERPVEGLGLSQRASRVSLGTGTPCEGRRGEEVVSGLLARGCR